MDDSKNKNAGADLLSTVFKGVLVGLVATQALDLIGSLIYENEDAKTRLEEDQARDNRQAYERGVAQMARAVGLAPLSREEEKRWGWRFHKLFGILGGIQYQVLRAKYPAVKKAYGLVYGVSFFIIADEVLIYLGKLSPGPNQFSWKVHARGALAHTAYGVASELTALAIESFPKVLIPEDRYLFSNHSS